MDYCDYRELLGIGFSDEEKRNMLINWVFNALNELARTVINGDVSYLEYYKFCNATCTRAETYLSTGFRGTERFSECVTILSRFVYSTQEFLYAYIALYHSLDPKKENGFTQDICKMILLKALDATHIQYYVNDKDGLFQIIPKGATELDKALVMEPLMWLKDYPNSRKAYITALKQYEDGVFIRDAADNLRKALEAFLQEFLGNSKNLESNKNEICKYLGTQKVDASFAGLFQPLINSYKSINDTLVKHNDSIDGKMLEFLLYQTGIFIRMIIVVKQAELEAD